ncbi:helix-turn-helix domain-containing protein [Bacillus sp. FJAT-27251]|uniref:helix-turn-helix domain-containing protein n=1 Tax=Bacillus sp. FJAT-27251 TaxID=1684142 RepID=UPI0006A7634B|nr:helix-turn-helix domain-containing protein [Bacillus sp. FJAT-27251]
MRDHKKSEELAVQRFQLISPLLAEGLDSGKLKELKDQIAKVNGLSERTIRRYLAQFRKDGFGGLKLGCNIVDCKPRLIIRKITFSPPFFYSPFNIFK